MASSRPARPRWTVLIRGAFLGAVFGVLFATNALCAQISLDKGGVGIVEFLEVWGFVLIMMGQLAGPGALVLGLVLTRILAPLASRVPGRKRYLVLGSACGIPFGFINLLAGVPIVLGMAGGMRMTVHELPHLAVPALAGGIGAGLGCALAVPFTGRPAPEDGEP